MSDERFDQDLRAVLLEDAPRDVPDELRRRVGAVCASPPVAVPPVRAAWRRPTLVWAAALAAAVVVVAIGAWQLRPNPDLGVGVGPSASPSAAPSGSPTAPSESASPSASPSAGVVACLDVDLDGQILGWQGAAGSRIADIQITNVAQRPCIIAGTPGLQLVDAHGQVLIDSAAAGPSGEPHVGPTDERFELAPGDTLQTEVAVSNYCGVAPSPPVDIAFILPANGGRLVVEPATGVSSGEATPPCMGPAAATIAMNGWKR